MASHAKSPRIQSSRVIRFLWRLLAGSVLASIIVVPEGDAQTSGLGQDISTILQQIQQGKRLVVQAYLPTQQEQPQTQVIQAPAGPPLITTPSRMN